MTSILGLFHRDGSGQAPLASPAIAALAARGPLEVAQEPAVILAGSQLDRIRDDFSEHRLIVALDGRIDNRGELEERLGLRDMARMSMAELIGHLYLKYKNLCPSFILGDFSFLVFDTRDHSVFGARDQFGVRPFYYYAAHDRFVAASTIGALLQSNVSDAIDDHGMADFVAGAFSDTCITLYRDIKRLPPGHWIRVDARHLRMEPYWALPEAEREARHDQAEEFQHIFEQAVQCRMTGTTSGSLLSGGLDSSSIAMVAQRCLTERQSAPLPSFSMTFHATPKWNEGAFIHAVLNAGQFMPHFLPSDDHDPLSAMATMLTEQEGPFLAYNHSVSRRLYRFARQTGVDTLLDGHGGDEVVSHGFGRLNELAMDRRWLRLWREAGGIAPLFGMSTRKVISPYLDHVRTIRRARASWRRMTGSIQHSTALGELSTSLVAPDLARRTDVEERQQKIQPNRSAYQTERERHREVLSSPHQPYAFEILDRAAVAANISLLFPFYDRRLVELCVSLPSSAKLADGYSRAILRGAMKNILPETVRLRRDKFDFTGQLATGLSRHVDYLLNAIGRRGDILAPYVDLDVARASIQRLKHPQSAGTAQVFPAWRVATLLHWLDTSAGQPKIMGE
jgi:asparagine synthase (glutamine-hydrolysing)